MIYIFQCLIATSATNRNSLKSAIKKSWVFAIGSMKASSSHILCLHRTTKNKEAGNSFLGDWDSFWLGNFFYF
jgi:hypothetical protein